jgi:predicted nucleotidyltransferase
MDFNLKNETVKIRKYLNALNSLLAMKWIIKNNSIPPIVFIELIQSCENKDIKAESLSLLSLHKAQTVSKNKSYVKNIPMAGSYIAKELEAIRGFIENLSASNPGLCLYG